VGASAVVQATYRSPEAVNTISLGSDKPWNVYAAELAEIYMAMKHIEDRSQLSIKRERDWYILTDSQSALRSLSEPAKKSRQQIILDILDRAKRTVVGWPIPRINLQWVPGHERSSGK